MALEISDNGDIIAAEPRMKKPASIAFQAVPGGPELADHVDRLIVLLLLLIRGVEVVAKSSWSTSSDLPRVDISRDFHGVKLPRKSKNIDLKRREYSKD